MRVQCHGVKKIDMERLFFNKSESASGEAFHVIRLTIIDDQQQVEEITLYSDQELSIQRIA